MASLGGRMARRKKTRKSRSKRRRSESSNEESDFKLPSRAAPHVNVRARDEDDADDDGAAGQ